VCRDVKNAPFEDNVVENNEQCGVSTGHGDSDSQYLRNTFRGNKWQGILFRRQQPPPDRCTFLENVFEDNGMGVKIDADVPGTVFEKNTFCDTRKDEKDRTQKVAIVSKVPITFKGNAVEGEVKLPAGSTL
jgi:nitrous oxidase accessory protein NosD